MKILFVDDVFETRSLFSVCFGMEGHVTCIAKNGNEAVEAVGSQHFDAIVMDVELPVLNGFEAARQIRDLPYGHTVPIVMFTGYSNPEDRRNALAAGANDLLCKPLEPWQLLARLRQLQPAPSPTVAPRVGK